MPSGTSASRRVAAAVALTFSLLAAPAASAEGATTVTAGDGTLLRNRTGHLAATVTHGATPAAAQTVTFTVDMDGDGAHETYAATTNSSGTALVEVMPTRPVGAAEFTASWTDGAASAADTGALTITDTTTTTLAVGNPMSGQVTDTVNVAATLTDSDGAAVGGAPVHVTIGGASATATTDQDGIATASVRLVAPVGESTLRAVYFGNALFGSSADTSSFIVSKEDTTLELVAAGGGRDPVVLAATLSEDGGTLAGKTIWFATQSKAKGSDDIEVMGSAVTDPQGVARLTVASKYVGGSDRLFGAGFLGDDAFLESTGTTTVTR